METDTTIGSSQPRPAADAEDMSCTNIHLMYRGQPSAFCACTYYNSVRTSRIGLGFRMRRHFPLGDLHDRMAVALLCQSQSIIAIVAMHDSRRRCMASADSERSRV